MKSNILDRGAAPVRYATKAIAEGEQSPHPADVGLIAQMREIAELVAAAPDSMLEAAVGELFDLMKLVPPDAALPLIATLVSRRPDMIEKAIASKTAVGHRVLHIEKALYIAYLFAPARVKLMACAAESFKSYLRGSPAEMV